MRTHNETNDVTTYTTDIEGQVAATCEFEIDAARSGENTLWVGSSRGLENYLV